MSASDATTATRSRPKSLSLEEQLERLERSRELVRTKIREDRRKVLVQLGEAVLAEAKDKAELMAMLYDLAGRRVPTKTGVVAVRALLKKG